MWNYLRSYVIWLHEPEHVARFQQYFGILPKSNRQPDVIPIFNENNLNKNNNNDSLISDNNNDHDKNFSSDAIYHRHLEEKITYDSNVLDECMEEIKHNTNQNEDKDKTPRELDYKITSWFWYYFYQFGAALGNEIFYIIFFPTWYIVLFFLLWLLQKQMR
jgi:hypothetical protein